jgi:hypothetical protein
MLARATGDARYLLLGNRLTVRPKSGPAEIHLLDRTGMETSLPSVFNLAVEPGWRPLLARFLPQS